MINGESSLNILQGIRYFGSACVIASDEDGKRIKVLLHNTDATESVQETWARQALPLPFNLVAGDTVLVAGEQVDNFYVIGVLDSEHKNNNSANCITTRSGARAEVDHTVNGERLKIISSNGTVVCEYDPENNKNFLSVQDGNLEIGVPDGDVTISTEKAIRMKSCSLEITSGKGVVSIDEAKFHGRRYSVMLDTAELVASRLETTIATVMQQADNVYSTVKELTQLSAGRLRTLIDGVWQTKCKKAFLKAEDDFKVKGEQIHLG